MNLLQDDNTVGVRPAANSALCYAAKVGSIPVMDKLIQKGAGKCLFNLCMYLKLIGVLWDPCTPIQTPYTLIVYSVFFPFFVTTV